MQAHQVKSVQQPAADRVCGMVAVCELAVVDDNTGREIGGDIVVAPVHGRRCIYIREEGVDGFLYGIGTAESTHHTRLCQRIGLLGNAVLYHLGLAAGYGPGGGIVPIVVTRKVFIRVKLCAVLLTLFQLAVFFNRFRGADGAAAAGAEIRPGDVLVLPLFIHAAVADCDLHLRTSSQVSVK